MSLSDATHQRIASLDSTHTVALELGPSSAGAHVRVFDDSGNVIMAPGVGSTTLDNGALSIDTTLYIEGIGSRSTSWDGQISQDKELITEQDKVLKTWDLEFTLLNFKPLDECFGCFWCI